MRVKFHLQRNLQRVLHRFGYKIARYYPPDATPEELDIIRAARPYTMTSIDRLFVLILAVRYVVTNRVAGSIVECGVWKGGSMMAAARTLLAAGQPDRELYLFDTFQGMPDAGDADISCKGVRGRDVRSEWFCAPLQDVQRAMSGTGYDERRIHYVKGKVEDTLPAAAPDSISLLRLDTDWYESTRHALEHLYPRLTRGGILIIDDYGQWMGARKAVDEYVAQNRLCLFLGRADCSARVCVKI